MSQWEFYKRRLIRLQPMVIMGSLIGALLFYFQAGPEFSLIAATPVWNAGGIRRLSNRMLGVLVLLAAAFLVEVAVTSPRGGLIGGWSLDPQELRIGFARVLFPFFAGILLRRTGKYVRTKHAFAVCSFVLVGALALPRLGDPQHLWVNGVYESICVVLIFPLVIAMGAGDKRVDGVSITSSGGTLCRKTRSAGSVFCLPPDTAPDQAGKSRIFLAMQTAMVIHPGLC
jgi:peptidoglycan/LPS O-acetylase OafA/YrhL